MLRKFLASVIGTLALSACATNPVTGQKNVVLSSTQSEKNNAQRVHEEIRKVYGLYEDQSVQDYVSSVGQRVALNSDLPDWEFKFFVLDDESINAFTTGGGYVYIHRGLLTYLNTEAELAAVLGHEIGHVTARHPQRQQTRGVMTSILATAAAVMTGSNAVADIANVAGTAAIQGYGRANEMEADRLGLKYATKTGYRPEAMGDVFKVFKQQEAFELNRARAEGRDPNIYHGIFSDHPAPDERSVQAAKQSAQIASAPPGGWIDNRDIYLKAIDGIPYGTSRAQGIVRDNRFYHADMGITLAFPKGWTVQNERDRILAFTPSKDTLMQVTADKRPEKQSPREFLIGKLKGASLAGGEAISSNGMDGYAILTRSGSPIDNGAGPVRWIALYREQSVYLFAGASRSANGSTPEADRLFLSVAETLRGLKPSEYPLAEPYRIKIVKADEKLRLDDYARNVPVEKYQKEELELINGIYPSDKPPPGSLVKVVE
jgi:predicted Zn-dependent protease